MNARIFLKSGRDAPVRGGNPWIFSGAIARAEPAQPEPGSIVEVRSADGALLGVGYCNLATTIAIRMLWWGGAPAIGEIVEARLRSAAALRRLVVRSDSDCMRLVNGDGDGLSGVVIDRYGEVLVVQLLTRGAERLRALLVERLVAMLRPRAIIERSQGAVRRQEGLEDRTGVLWGEAVCETLATENGLRLAIDLEHGQKTGYFLDQRENRARLGAMAEGARVLDAYCYAGGFALAALRGKARRVVGVDTSARALSWARRNLSLNGYGEDAAELIHAEAGEYMAKTSERFDLISLDPPPLARSRKDRAQAAHLYTRLNELAIRLLTPGGCLMTFSCSAHFRGDDFVHAVGAAQARARRNLRILAHLGPAPDHPVLLGHAEGEYLSGLLLADLG
jgi:23S rRNA (cytosine1962-C5)-methyltransferase